MKKNHNWESQSQISDSHIKGQILRETSRGSASLLSKREEKLHIYLTSQQKNRVQQTTEWHALTAEGKNKTKQSITIQPLKTYRIKLQYKCFETNKS